MQKEQAHQYAPTSFSGLIWFRWPKLLFNVAPALGIAASHGNALGFQRGLGVAVPMLVAVASALFGALNAAPAYAGSLIGLIGISIMSGIGAGIGLVGWFAYCVGDLVHWRYNEQLYGSGLLLALAVGLADFLLFYILVGIPILATGITNDLARRFPTAPKLMAPLLEAIILSFIVALWMTAAPFLLRPLWSFVGLSPSASDIQPFQEWRFWLGAVAGITSFLRLAYLGPDQRLTLSRQVKRSDRPLRLILANVCLATLIALMLSGIFDKPFFCLIFGAATFLVLFARMTLAKHLPQYYVVFSYLPLLLRLLIASAISFALGQLLVDASARAGESSFMTLSLAIFISFTVFALLFPPTPV